ncbi:MAG: hypothetical protein LLG01_15120 [Planctomycetaceae bacterium]|nr:hypothetical protein [Planctomycetaceae bacterium]
MTKNSSPFGTLSRPMLITLIVIAALVMPLWVYGLSRPLIMLVVLTALEGVAAAVVFVAAGGYGYLIVRRWFDDSAPLGLRVVTASALGVWLLAAAIMLAGTAATGLMKMWIWWPVLAIGVLLAAWQGRRRLEGWHVASSFDSRAMVWLALAVAGGAWLVGACRENGLWAPGFGAAMETLWRDLQIPREYYLAQHVSGLRHNCFSYEPMTTQMLSLLAMALRGGPYEGMYLAKFLQGGFAVLAVAGIVTALKGEDTLRWRIASALIVSTPLLLMLGWAGGADLAALCYLTLAVLWVRQWSLGRDWRAAACVGALLGAAWSSGHEAFIPVVLPLLAVSAGYMLLRRRMGHAGVVVAGVLVMMAPWMIRAAAYTGNPVFPRMTSALGRGYWSPEQQERWLHAHSVPPGSPVPAPPDWTAPEQPSRAQLFYHKFVAYSSSELLGVIMLVMAVAAFCAVVATPGAAAWEWLLAATAAGQLLAWALLSPSMEIEQIVTVVVPLSLLAAGGLARLAQVQVNPLNKNAERPASGPWGVAPAVAITAMAVLVNLVTAGSLYFYYSGDRPARPGSPIETHPDMVMPVPALTEGGYIVLAAPEAAKRSIILGDPRVFCYPAGSVYASPFDEPWLASIERRDASGEQILQAIKKKDVSYIVVRWADLWRQAITIGYPSVLADDLFERWSQGRGAGLGILDQLQPLGLRVQEEIYLPEGATQISTSAASTTAATTPAAAGASSRSAATQAARGWQGYPFPRRWPLLSVYALPWAPQAQTRPATAPAKH